ncbi:hypothetical protein EV424DRAFT_1351421 [Suillus variegatus]|nr:hypothetical protein EV424DRAFT_1351421 [Suillus variegatus]
MQGKLIRRLQGLPAGNGVSHLLATFGRAFVTLNPTGQHRLHMLSRSRLHKLKDNAKANPRSQSASTAAGSAQASGGVRHNYQATAASPLPREVTSQNESAQSSRQAGLPGHTQDRVDRGDRESVDSGIIYTERDTESVEAHGCWNIFWNWLCYKGRVNATNLVRSSVCKELTLQLL